MGYRWFCVISIAVFLLPAGGCTVYLPDSPEIVFLSYNIENLFDALDDGNEYPEYTSIGGWTERDYQRRLQRLGEAIGSIRPAPDVLVFQEVEHQGVLATLMDEHLVDINAPYRAFARGAHGSIGVAIASRYPIVAARTHSAWTRADGRLRPVLEVELDIAGQRVYLFANHWKSKRGGAAATEPLRRAAARLLAARVHELWQNDPETAIVVAGDFNSTPDEYLVAGNGYPTALFPAAVMAEILNDPDIDYWWATDRWMRLRENLLLASDSDEALAFSQVLQRPVLINMWEYTNQPGSFSFFGSWEQIDSFFISPSLMNGTGLDVASFDVHCLPEGCDSEGRPRSWQDHPRGISDHLPLLLRVAPVDSGAPDTRGSQLVDDRFLPALVGRR